MINLIIESSLYLIFLTFVWLILKQLMSIRYQRVTVLLLPFLSVIPVLVKLIPVTSQMRVEIPVEVLPEIQVTDTITTTSTGIPWLWYAYAVGIALVLGFYIFQSVRVLRFFISSRHTNGAFIKETDKYESFSFFKFIHIQDQLEDDAKDIVLQHEKIHVQLNHSFDHVLYAIYHSLFWFNPVMILLKRELSHIHEYEVDQKMYGEYQTNYLTHLVNYALDSKAAMPLMTSQFHGKLTLKKRIQMMTNYKKRNFHPLTLILPVMVLVISAIACETVEAPEADQSAQQEVVEAPLVKAEYPGGMDAMIKFLMEEVKYPEALKEAGVEGKVFIQFTIMEDGSLSDITVKRGAEEAFNQEAIRVVKAMPKWKPATKEGKNVSSIYTLPFNFKL